MRASGRRTFASAAAVLLGGAVMLAACGGNDPDTGSAAGAPAAARTEARAAAPVASAFDVGEVKPTAEYLAEPRYQEADLRRGEVLALACRACHTVGAGQGHQLGPNLHGVFGREAASLEGFDYSDALRESGIVWTPRALEAWLQHPSGFIPGNSMIFAGLRADVDRRDLLAYLLRVTEQ
jgi:cytochrome c